MATATAATTRREDVLADGTMSPGKAAAFSGFSRTAIYNAMSSGQLAFFTKGSRGRLIAKKVLVTWMATQLKPAQE